MALDSNDDDVPSPPELEGITPVDPDGDRDAPAHPITVLRVFGQARELRLTNEKQTYVAGRDLEPAVDLTLDHELVSRVHAKIHRKGNKLQVVDQNSRNGTYRRGERDDDFEVGAGETFQVTRKITLLALDESLALLRRKLHWAIGLRAHGLVDEALAVAAMNGPVLLIGPDGCDQHRLAHEMHRLSPRRRGPFVVVPLRFAPTSDDTPAERRGLCLDLSREEQAALLRRAENGTLFLDLSAADPKAHKLPAYFVNHLMRGGEYSIRPIIAAPSKAQAEHLLDELTVDLFGRVDLPPLSSRGDDVPRLLDALIRQAFDDERRENPPRLAELGPESLAGLAMARWPGNIAELRRDAVPILCARLVFKTLRKTADALGKSKSWIAQWLQDHNVQQSFEEGNIDADAITNQNEVPTPPEAIDDADRDDA